MFANEEENYKRLSLICKAASIKTSKNFDMVHVCCVIMLYSGSDETSFFV